MTVDHFDIISGKLYAYYNEGDNMAVVDLGKVVGDTGPAGPIGLTGPKGDTGPQGPKGNNGISPTFSINESGHLLADYDNPYVG